MSNIKVHKPDSCHSWGIEFNYELNSTADAMAFVSACYKILWNKNLFPRGVWFHQSGSDTSPQYRGYQFFEYWGPEQEVAVLMAAALIANELNCIIDKGE